MMYNKSLLIRGVIKANFLTFKFVLGFSTKVDSGCNCEKLMKNLINHIINELYPRALQLSHNKRNISNKH
jgi:hypothetical protein